jgi:hypothetical protein
VWRPIAQSLQGPSHLQDASPCQDSHSLRVVGENGAQTLVACVSDGAGSAKFSNIGSERVCRSILESAVGFLSAGGQLRHLLRDDVLRWCDLARECVNYEAELRECEPRELASTLCAALIAPEYSCFFQIGDGAMVLRRQGVYGVVFWPQTGEYANSTNFLTGKQYQEQLEFVSVEGSCSDVALFTDGLERLALRFDDQTPMSHFSIRFSEPCGRPTTSPASTIRC